MTTADHDDLDPAVDDAGADVDGNIADTEGNAGAEPLGNEVTARVSRSLHTELVALAEAENLSVDELVGELLIEALALRDARNTRRKGRAGGNRRDSRDNRGNRRSYNEIMDDKASFLEYVRNVEQERGGNRRPNRRRRNRNRGRDED